MLDAATLRRRLERMFVLQGERGGGDDALVRQRLAVAFVHRDPDLAVMLDARGGDLVIRWDDLSPAPDLLFELPTSAADAFWSGELNVMKALTAGTVKMRGSVLKALAIAGSQSASQAAYRDARAEEAR